MEIPKIFLKENTRTERSFNLYQKNARHFYAFPKYTISETY